MILSSEPTNNTEVCAFLLPVYGGDKAIFFRRALESIFAQLVDSLIIRVYLGIDGPLDETLEAVVEEFSQRIYKIIRHKDRLGVAHNLNALISLLENEGFVFRMDSDDICMPKRVSLQVAYLKMHPDIGILGGAIQELGPNGRQLGIRTYPGRAEIKKYIQYASPLAHPTVVFRRETLNVLGGYPVAEYNEDIQMWFKALEIGIEIDNLPETVLLYQVNNEFYKRRSYAKALGEAKAYIVGNYRLQGLSLALLLPFLRLLFRLMPSQIVRVLYHWLPIRRMFLNTHSLKQLY